MTTTLPQTKDADKALKAKPTRKSKSKELYSNLCGDCFDEFTDTDIQRAADRLREHKGVCRGPRHDKSGKQLY